jgi:hypothetical protein
MWGVVMWQSDVASRSYQLLCVAMMDTVLTWQETLAPDPAAAPLRRILADCLERLLATFQRYIAELVSISTTKATLRSAGLWESRTIESTSIRPTATSLLIRMQ